MNRYFRKYQRCFTDLSNRQKCVLIGFIISVLWILGLLDRFRETPYQDFNWPSENPRKFKFPTYNGLPSCKRLDLLSSIMIIVKSSASNRKMRDAIRKTWGQQNSVENVEINTIFIIGESPDFGIREKNDEEALVFNDILRIDAVDSYRNNTLKLFASLNFALNPSNCAPPDFLFLVDDDYMVHIHNLVHFAKNKQPDEMVYEGYVFDTSPFRFTLHKHRISIEEYPYSQYPPYVSAGSVFLSTKTVKLFQQAIPMLKMFPFDDVYTGIVAKSVDVPAIHNENFIFWSRHVTKSEWEKGIIAAHGYGEKNRLKEAYDEIFN